MARVTSQVSFSLVLTSTLTPISNSEACPADPTKFVARGLSKERSLTYWPSNLISAFCWPDVGGWVDMAAWNLGLSESEPCKRLSRSGHSKHSSRRFGD